MKHSPRFLAVAEFARAQVNEISAEQLNKMPDPAATIIDTREASEWQTGTIPGAVHLSKGVIERDIERAIADPQTPLILFCSGGYRSCLAAQSLQQMGYTNVTSLKGGYKAWCELGLPVQVPV